VVVDCLGSLDGMNVIAYVDSNLVGTGKVTQAAILGQQGGVWATSAGFAVRVSLPSLPAFPYYLKPCMQFTWYRLLSLLPRIYDY
jgi:hypothetical protein